MTPESSYRSSRRPDSFPRLLRAAWADFRSARRLVLTMVASVLVTVSLGLLVAGGARSTCVTWRGDGPCPAPLTGPDGTAVNDKYYFVHQPLKGDGTITARVSDLTGQMRMPDVVPGVRNVKKGVVPWGKAGLLIRPTLKQGSPYAAVMITGNHGVRMQHNFTHDTAGSPARGTRWLRLTRTADTLTGYESGNGQTWSRVGTVELAGLPETVEIGLFATSPGVLWGSAQAFAQATATFDQIRLQGTNGTWQHDDVGVTLGPDGKTPHHPGAAVAGPDGKVVVTGGGDIGPATMQGGLRADLTLLGGAVGLTLVLVTASMYGTPPHPRTRTGRPASHLPGERPPAKYQPGQRPPAKHQPGQRPPAKHQSAEHQSGERLSTMRLPAELPSEHPLGERLLGERHPSEGSLGERLPSEGLPAARSLDERLSSERLPSEGSLGERPPSERPPSVRPPSVRLPGQCPSSEHSPSGGLPGERLSSEPKRSDGPLGERLPSVRPPSVRPPSVRLPGGCPSSEHSPSVGLPGERLSSERQRSDGPPGEHLPSERPSAVPLPGERSSSELPSSELPSSERSPDVPLSSEWLPAEGLVARTSGEPAPMSRPPVGQLPVRLLVAKAVVVGVVGFVAGLVTAGVVVPAGLALLRAHQNPIQPITLATELRVIAGFGALTAAVAVLALGLAALVGRAVVAAVPAVALVVLPYLLAVAGLAPWLLAVTPAAGFAITQSVPTFEHVDVVLSPLGGYYPLPPWAGLAVTCAYAVLVLGAAVIVHRRKAMR
ncbi:hypothetical protein [[Actinomadura] parvosata]|uniref:hypothetical protein n=1 Tax=[Actinomadura] parvosata TaxID=1955412 RepID=UPI001646D454|nr:hypothetical protein [Nonomuraea sp. ATCC 55076]